MAREKSSQYRSAGVREIEFARPAIHTFPEEAEPLLAQAFAVSGLPTANLYRSIAVASLAFEIVTEFAMRNGEVCAPAMAALEVLCGH